MTSHLSPAKMSAQQYKHLPVSTTAQAPGKAVWSPHREEEKMSVLPDIVLCSALSAGIAQARRQRRQRHPATVQTPGVIIPTGDPDTLMEPLIPDMERLCAKKKKQKSRLVSLVRLLIKFPLKLKSC